MAGLRLDNGSPSVRGRADAILAAVASQDFVTVRELTDALKVSDVTIRQDLNTLADAGLIQRTRGGARRVTASSSAAVPEFENRLRLHVPEKRAIAQAAATLVNPGEAIAIDASSTGYFLAGQLRDMAGLIVVTNGIRVAEVFADRPQITVLLLGGIFKPLSQSTIGPYQSAFPGVGRLSTGFFGASAVTPEHGLLDVDPASADAKRQLVENCDHVVGIVDATKFNRFALVSFAPPEQITSIVTDDGVEPDALIAWETSGVKALVAATDSEGGAAYGSRH